MVARNRSARTGRRQKWSEIDDLIGYNLRTYRLMSGMTQRELGDAVGVTFQQIQKYEKGVNRISATTLYQVAAVLGIGVEQFFVPLYGAVEPLPPLAKVALPDRESLEVARLYAAMDNEEMRRVVGQLLRLLTAPPASDSDHVGERSAV